MLSFIHFTTLRVDRPILRSTRTVIKDKCVRVSADPDEYRGSPETLFLPSVIHNIYHLLQSGHIPVLDSFPEVSSVGQCPLTFRLPF